MSSAVAPSVKYDHDASSVHDKKDAPRKRSKVSRACDACRRKKVRCNGEYSSVYQKVTKICTNCSKAGELCTFSRIPLKRGPSKGYIRDMSDHMEPLDAYSQDSTWRPRSKSVDVAQYQNNGSGRYNTPPSPVSSTSAKPNLHRPKLASTSSTSPIILPPLIGTSHQPMKLNVNVSNPMGAPLSPPNMNASGKPNENQDNVVKGPFWKVPYEMPTSGGPDSNASSPGMSALDFNSRRSSVDSVSSLSSAGSRSRLPSLQPSLSIASDLSSSRVDSDDQSGRSSTCSPRNSITSLSSLNGRVANNLNINSYSKPPSPHAFNSPTYPNGHAQAPYANGGPGPAPQLPYKNSVSMFPLSGTFPQAGAAPNQPPFYHIPFNSLEYNVHLYHTRFQGSFPILTFEEDSLVKLVTDMQKSAGITFEVASIFNTALNNMIHYQLVPTEASSSLLVRLMSFYSTESKHILSDDNMLVVLCIALSLVNYALLLKGESCSIGVSLLAGILHDSNIAESLHDPRVGEITEENADEKVPTMLRLLLLLHIIDSSSSLTQGTYCQLPSPSEILFRLIPSIMPKDSRETPFVSDLKIGVIFTELSRFKRENWNSEELLIKTSELLSSQDFASPAFHFAAQFVSMLQDKYQLYCVMQKVKNTIASNDKASLTSDSISQVLSEQRVEVSKSVKKLSSSIMNFANYVSSIYVQARSISNNKASLLNNPYFNVSFGQCLKLINVCKILIDSISIHTKENEVINRTIKVYNDLSIAFNLIVNQLNSRSALIETAKSSLNSQSQLNGSNNALSLPESMDVNGLGVSFVGELTKKVAKYNLNVHDVPIHSNEEKKEGSTKDMLDWVDDFISIFNSTVLTDRSQSWA